MKILFTFLVAAFIAPIISAQNDAKKDTVAAPKACIIVKRHVHKFGENMSRFHAHRPFDYVEKTKRKPACQTCQLRARENS